MTTATKPRKQTTKKVLVVEDEGEMRLVIDMILHDWKLDIDFTNSLIAADERIEKHKPSVIILDNKLPDGYGVDSIRYFKKKFPSVKIMMISGFPTVGDVAIENGADAFLEKPFSLEDFNKVLDDLLSR